jgi:hypothetical protein
MNRYLKQKFLSSSEKFAVRQPLQREILCRELRSPKGFSKSIRRETVFVYKIFQDRLPANTALSKPVQPVNTALLQPANISLLEKAG